MPQLIDCALKCISELWNNVQVSTTVLTVGLLNNGKKEKTVLNISYKIATLLIGTPHLPSDRLDGGSGSP
jgi:hypothetical protein